MMAQGSSILVKAAVPACASFTIVGTALGLAGEAPLAVEPLMPHVAARTTGAAALGVAAGSPAQWFKVTLRDKTVLPWDICHRLTAPGGRVGIASHAVEFAEPDMLQPWRSDNADRDANALAAAPGIAPQDKRFPLGETDDWYRDARHSNFAAALAALGDPPATVRVAHLDTGYDPALVARLFPHLRTDLQYDFVGNGTDASDATTGIANNRGHGTGTLGILCGGAVAPGAAPIGAAPFIEVVPLRVANRVVEFYNSAIARALDYVLKLCENPATRIDIVTMSMGGLASHAWADAVNALYDAGVFIVTAAGNNFDNLPTRNIVYPARFNRVVAACGVMANGKPYADLAAGLMAGNYGPTAKMCTSIAASMPNLPWLRLGGGGVVDHNGAGTSAATPQVAAAAAIWLAKYRGQMTYSQPWMVVEAARSALFAGARSAADSAHFGNGLLDAANALNHGPPGESDLHRQPVDTADFPLLRVLLGTGGLSLTESSSKAQMLELEALQWSQHVTIERLLPDPTIDPAQVPAQTRKMIATSLASDSRASNAMRKALGAVAPAAPSGMPESTTTVSTLHREDQLEKALAPAIRQPRRRKLRVFASDPTLAS